jgi:hypothetical protein
MQLSNDGCHVNDEVCRLGSAVLFLELIYNRKLEFHEQLLRAHNLFMPRALF